MSAFLKIVFRWLRSFFAGPSQHPPAPLSTVAPKNDTAPSAEAANPAPSGRRSQRRQPPSYSHSYPAVREVATQAEARAAVEAEDALALVRADVGYKWLVMRCPCGCGEIRRVSLSPSVRPTWRYELDRTGHVSLFPSVDLMSSCRAHFVLRRNIAFGF